MNSIKIDRVRKCHKMVSPSSSIYMTTDPRHTSIMFASGNAYLKVLLRYLLTVIVDLSLEDGVYLELDKSFGNGRPPFGVFDVILTYLDNLLW